jgi:hypothetical protein
MEKTHFVTCVQEKMVGGGENLECISNNCAYLFLKPL